jgi:hypothetical protein
VQTPHNTRVDVSRTELHSHCITHAQRLALRPLGDGETVGGLRQW